MRKRSMWHDALIVPEGSLSIKTQNCT